jgi:hypothetical protein
MIVMISQDEKKIIALPKRKMHCKEVVRALQFCCGGGGGGSSGSRVLRGIQGESLLQCS